MANGPAAFGLVADRLLLRSNSVLRQTCARTNGYSVCTRRSVRTHNSMSGKVVGDDKKPEFPKQSQEFIGSVNTELHLF